MITKPTPEYKQYYDSQNGRSGMEVVQTNLQILEDFLALLEKEHYILDIGCRTGKIVNYLHTKGYANSFGMDIGENAENNWKQGLTELYNAGKLKKEDIHNSIPFNYIFHMIIITHVIEHLYDLNKALKNIHNKLRNTGLLFTQVPIQEQNKFEKNKPHLIKFESKEDYINTIESNGFVCVYEKEGFVAENPEVLAVFQKQTA